jgi:hypothetical protein
MRLPEFQSPDRTTVFENFWFELLVRGLRIAPADAQRQEIANQNNTG